MIVDSSVWIEILKSGPLQSECEEYIKNAEIKIPVIVLYEVYKKIKLIVSEEAALEVVASLSQHEVVELTGDISLLAADLSIELNLPMADSLVLAFARYFKVELLTLDHDFVGLKGVKIIQSKVIK